jgi:hypothetical protein
MNDDFEQLQRLKQENAALRQQLSLKPYLQRMGLRNDAFGYVRHMLEERYDMSETGEFTAKEPMVTPASWHRWAESLRSSHPFLFGGSRTTSAEGRAGDNPWRKESFNLTQQALLTRRDPALARAMASEAGAGAKP